MIVPNPPMRARHHRWDEFDSVQMPTDVFYAGADLLLSGLYDAYVTCYFRCDRLFNSRQLGEAQEKPK